MTLQIPRMEQLIFIRKPVIEIALYKRFSLKEAKIGMSKCIFDYKVQIMCFLKQKFNFIDVCQIGTKQLQQLFKQCAQYSVESRCYQWLVLAAQFTLFLLIKQMEQAYLVQTNALVLLVGRHHLLHSQNSQDAMNRAHLVHFSEISGLITSHSWLQSASETKQRPLSHQHYSIYYQLNIEHYGGYNRSRVLYKTGQ